MTCFDRRTERVGRRGVAGSTRVVAILGVVAVVVVVLAMLRGPGSRPLTRDGEVGGGGSAAGEAVSAGSSQGVEERVKPRLASRGGGSGASGAAAIVADKVVAYAQGRRQVVETLARRLNVEVPPAVGDFFAAVESGNWREVKAQFHAVSSQVGGAGAAAGMAALLPAIKEAYAVAEAREAWPAEDLLAYGQDVLAALKPGMVYVGGSRWGSAIPSLMNETSGEGRAVLLDQTMMSEPGYVEYLAAMYGDRMTTLTAEDAERARGGYAAREKERARENGAGSGGNAPAPGGGASEIAENLMLALLWKNPGMTVAMEKPVPGSALYELATPMGPIFEVRAPAAAGENPGPVTTPAQAEQTVRYWQDTVAKLQSAPETEEMATQRRTMADMALTQAQMLASRSLNVEAELTYRTAIDIAPMALEPVDELARFLHGAGREPEAQQVLDAYLNRNPGKESEVGVLRSRLGGTGR